jgi:lincosamide nucleotidyltransferase A/C/D/E
MVTTKDALEIYKMLSAHGIPIWLTGGWGIDALLGEQTRPHKDLDVLVLLDDLVRARELLESNGYELKELWSENKFVKDRNGDEIPTAFVLHDAHGREFDAHAMTIDEQGNGIPAWNAAADFFFAKQELAGQGTIAGFSVQCLTPASQIRCHEGYELPDVQKQDLDMLKEKFNL